MARILLTGATGLVGSSLVPSLLARGHELTCLVRPQGNLTPAERLRGILGIPVGPESTITALAGDITIPSVGIGPHELEMLRGKVDKIVHCAASVKFDEELREETWRMNAGGTEHMLSLATKLDVGEFHHLSTIYVAGDAEHFSEADAEIGQTPRNPYEASKKAAEKLIRGWGGNYSIYRLGVIVGDSQTGTTSSFEGYYGFFLPFRRLQQMIEKKWSEKRKDYQREGIRLTPGCLLHLPLYLDCSAESTINLVPIDWLVDMLTKLIGKPAEDRVYHLADVSPRSVRWAAKTSLKHMGITGLRFGKPEQSLPRLLSRLQRGVDRELGRYRPYITHEAQFKSGNLDQALDGEFVPMPEINESVLAKLIGYAMSVDFDQTVVGRRAAA